MMLQLAIVLMMFLAFGLLAQAMPRHAKQLWGKALTEQAEKRSRFAGSTLLLLSFALLCYYTDIWGAILVWLGYTTLCTLAVALILSYQPIWLSWLLKPTTVIIQHAKPRR